MLAGQNDLNMLLKAQVVKIRAELDVKGSLPRIKEQIKEISKKLEKNPVKLQVELDYKIGELKKQMRLLQTSLNTAKTLKPIKIKVEIDVKGSATQIRKQLQEVNRVVDEFNKKYGEQVKKMQEQVNKHNRVISGAGQGGKRSSNSMTYQMIDEIKEAEKALRQMYSPKTGSGLFGFSEFRDAEGNVRGFVAQLEKANGVVHKIRYEWNKEAGKFTPITQETVDATQKHVHKATQSLRSLSAEIQKLQDSKGKDALWSSYAELERRAGQGTLTNDAVKDLKRQIKEEQVLQQQIDKTNKEYIERQKLLRDIRVARDRGIQKDGSMFDIKPYQQLIKNVKEGTSSIAEQRLELRRLQDEEKKRETNQKKILENTKKRIQLLRELRRIERQTPSDDETSNRLIREIKHMAERAKHARDWIEIQKQMNALRNSNDNDKELDRTIALMDKAERKLREYGRMQNQTAEEIEKSIRNMQNVAMKGYADLEKLYYRVNKQVKDLRDENKRVISEGKVLLSGQPTNVNDAVMAQNIRTAVDNRDVQALQAYIGQIYKGQVETVKMEQTTDHLGRAVDRLRIKMAGTGKTVKSYVVDLDRANGELRQMQQGLDYNANRNLGVFEQLRIAMERVPVWMTAMTAFYGSIRAVQAMSREILQVDKALTELKRVASDDIQIDKIFKGAVDLSKQLGNNVHDVMQTLNDFSRTFGEFNERQLLAITNTATLMSNVSELSAIEAGEALISTMNAFNIEAEESIRIVDAFNEVDNNFAVSTKQLAEGLSKTASTAKTFGVTMEESVGHITAISAVTQESGKIIGNALKTIYSRITTMDDAETILNSVNVQIKDMEGNVRPVQDILSDLGSKWDELSDAQRQQIGVTLAGRYQLSRFLAMMNNWDMAIEATTTALTSQGSAMRENDKYLESFEARINQLKVGFTELALSVGDAILSDGMMTLIELGKSLAQVVTDLIDKFGALPALFLAIAGVMGKFGYLSKIHSGFVGLIDKVTSLGKESRITAQEMQTAQKTMLATTTATKGVETAMNGATTAAKTLGASIKGALASTVIGAVFVGVGMLIEHFIGKMAEAKREAEEFEKQQNRMVEAFHKVGSAKGLEDLINQYDKLADKANRTTEEEQEYQALRAQLVENFPTLIDHYDEEGNAVLKSTEAMKDQIPTLEKLSRAKANVTKAEFKEKIEKEVESWNKLSENIEKTSKKIAELRKKPETSEVPMVTGYEVFAMPENSTIKTKDGKGVIEINNAKALAKEEQKLLQLQQERAHQLNVINKLISDQTLAYMEVDGVMSKLSDKQIEAIEDYSSSHTKSINKRLKELEKEGASHKEIADFLETKGKAIAQKGTEIAKAYSSAFEEVYKATDGSQASFNDVRTAIDSVASSLDESFYKFKEMDDINDQIVELAQISYEMKTAGEESFGSYIERIKAMGYSTDEATKIVGNLAKEQQNAEIYQQALKQGFEETTSALDDYNASLLETIDLTSALLGDGASEEMKALESNIALIMLYNDKLGESASKHWEYNEALSNTALSLGVSEEQLLKNIENIAFLTQVTGELNPVLNETADGVTAWNELSEEQIEKLKKLGITQDDLLMKYIEHQNWQTAILDVLGLLNAEREAEASATENSKNKTKEDTQAKKENAEATDAQAQAVETLTGKFNTFKEKADTVSRSAYIDTIKQQLEELDGKIIVTQDNTGGLKLAMADGTESQWLNTLQRQLGELGFDLGLVKDDAGNIKLVLNDATGSTTLATIEADAEDAKIALSDTITEHEILKEKAKSLPNDYSQIDFTKLFSGLETTTEKVQFLSEALEGVWENVKFLDSIQGTVDKLKGAMETVRDEIKSLFDSNKGDFGELEREAVKAKEAIKDVQNALSKMNNKAREIPLDAFNGFKKDANEAKEYMKSLKSEVDNLAQKISGLNGASALYAVVMSTIGATTQNAVNKLSEYVTKLQELTGVLSSVAVFNQKLAISQSSISSSMRSVVMTTSTYGTAIASTAGLIAQAYVSMSVIISTKTMAIVNEYQRHGIAVRNLEKVTINAWNDIIKDTRARGGDLVKVIREISNNMKKVFQEGMENIVNVAKKLPSKIGKGVRDHMESASSSMDAVAKDMVKRFKKELGIHSPSRVFEELGGWVIKGLANGLTGEDLKSLGKQVFSDFGGGVFDSWEMIKAYVSNDWSNFASGGYGGGVERWRGVAMKALAMTGQLTPANLERLLFQMRTESGGNPRAINLWDINAKRGTPSKGLMQVIDPTFQAYKMPGYNNIWNPLDNILASIRYTLARYGSLLRGWRGVGYEEGGFIEKEHLAIVGEDDKREVVIPLEQHRTRAVDLWRQAGEELGLLRKIRSYGGFGAYISGGFGALSGEGGSVEGGGGSGTSGIIQPSIYEGGVNLDGDYQFMAFANKKELEALYTWNKNDRTADAYSHAISMIETRMRAMTENTLQYRNALKQVIFESQKLASIEKAELSRLKNRQKQIEKQIKSLGQTSKHSEAQRKKYNELQREYEQNIDKIQSLERSIEETNQKIKNNMTEIFIDWVDEIVGKYNNAIEGITAKVDNIQFELDVLELTDPENIKKELDLLAKRARGYSEQEATIRNMVNHLQKEYDKAVKKYGKSSKEAQKVKQELDNAKESLEDITLQVLRAEKDIEDARGTVADKGISQLKDYYGKMKDMALKAIELEKRELQKAHEEKMKMYDKEIERINNVYDERLKAMDKEKEEAEYQEQLDEKNKKRAELVNKISLLSRDTSVEGRKRVDELRRELEQLDQEIAQFMRERQDKLLREEIENQRKQQIDELEAQKEAEQEDYDTRVEELDKEAGDISKYYDDMLNDERKWAEMRENFIKGSFSTLTQELEEMSKQLARMTQGNFNNLTKGFSGFSEELKQEFAELFGIDISNMNFNSEGLLDQVADAQKSKYGVYIGDGYSVGNPKETTWSGGSSAVIYDAKAPTAPPSSSKSSNKGGKPLKVGGKAKVNVKNAPAYIDSYGRQVRPWADQAKYAGVGYSDPLYVVNIRGGYVALAKRNNINDAIAWVRERDVIGLRTGGYTGEWAGQDGKLALLHKKELVLNEKQTSHILDTAKIMDKVRRIMPDIKRSSVIDKLATAGTIVNNITYGDINVTVEGGDKKKAKDIATEILKGIKKKGR
jgi:TP901 family phage tail tape measure protein